jgi:acyl carrier protein
LVTELLFLERIGENQQIKGSDMATLDQATIKQKIRNFIAETFLIGEDKDKLEDADSFMQKEIIDSTGVLELATFIESEFGIVIEDNEMVPDNLDSIQNLSRFISRKLG